MEKNHWEVTSKKLHRKSPAGFPQKSLCQWHRCEHNIIPPTIIHPLAFYRWPESLGPVEDHNLPGFAEAEPAHLHPPFFLFVKKERSGTVTKDGWYLYKDAICMVFPHLCLLIDIPGKGHSIECNFFNIPNGIKTLLVISCKKQQTNKTHKKDLDFLFYNA